MNLSVWEQLEFYPHDCDGHVSEVWHGKKMTWGENHEQLTPMASYGGQLFFVDEVAQLDDGLYFFLDMFLKRHGQLCVCGHKLIAKPEVSDSNIPRVNSTYSKNIAWSQPVQSL